MTTPRAVELTIAANNEIATFQFNDVFTSNLPAGHSKRSVLHTRMRDAIVGLVVGTWFLAEWTFGGATPDFFDDDFSWI